MKLEFKSFMFNSIADTIHGGVFELCPDFAKLISDIANEKLPEIKESWKAEMLKDAVVVYGQENHAYGYTITRDNTDTHKALLINITPIVKEPCKEHIPKIKSSKQIMISDVAVAHHGGCTIVCGDCGVELFAEWKEKK